MLASESRAGLSQPVFSPDGQSLAFFATTTADQAGRARRRHADNRLCASNGAAEFELGGRRSNLWHHRNRHHACAGQGWHAATHHRRRRGRIPVTPQLLPGDRDVLFTIARGSDIDRWDKARIVVQTIGTDTRTTLIEIASSGHYLPSGQLVYGQGDSCSPWRSTSAPQDRRRFDARCGRRAARRRLRVQEFSTSRFRTPAHSSTLQGQLTIRPNARWPSSIQSDRAWYCGPCGVLLATAGVARRQTGRARSRRRSGRLRLNLRSPTDQSSSSSHL